MIIDGNLVLIDPDLEGELSRRTWRINKKTGYVMAHDYDRVTKKVTPVYMHRVVMGCSYKDGISIDHINRNKLDNRKVNLRTASPRENSRNRGLYKSDKPKYVGVTIKKVKYKTRTYSYILAAIGVCGKRIHLGHFDTEQEAAHAYNEAAKKYFGEFANLNVIG